MKLAISPHSVVDVITNSSSEIFVCKTDRSVEVVREILVDLLNMYNKHNDLSISFDDMFAEPFIIVDKGDFWGHGNVGQIIIESKWDNTIPRRLWDYIELTFDAYRFQE